MSLFGSWTRGRAVGETVSVSSMVSLPSGAVTASWVGRSALHHVGTPG